MKNTETRLAQEWLKNAERRKQALLDNSPVCHKIVDLDLNLQYMTDNGFAMLKLPLDAEVYGKPYPFSFFPAAFRKKMAETLKRVIETGDPTTLEALARDTEGNDVWLDSTIFPVRDGNGKMDALTVVTADSTQRQMVEQEKNCLEGQLRQAQKMEAVGRLAGGVAHDFNNMLSLIIGHAEMAMDDLDPSHPAYADLEQIRKAGERSTSLTRQLLAFASKQTVAPKVIDVNETVEGMLKMLRRLMGEDIRLEWRPGENVWPVKIDPSQMDQILANLCVNARDAIANIGNVVIETGNQTFEEPRREGPREFEPGDYVRIIVGDNGEGMDAETLENIFEPFFTTKQTDRGTGLGLATVYGVVQQNHGFVHVHSETGLGSTFTIYLPRYETVEETMVLNEQTSSNGRGNETVLLVEDEPSILNLTKMMLEKMGYRVLAAGTPGGAIALAREYTGDIHLLLTDVIMPEMNGRDLALEILSLHPDLRHLFMSGYPADVIADHGILEDGVNFIHKPFSRRYLGNKVREVLDGVPNQIASKSSGV